MIGVIDRSIWEGNGAGLYSRVYIINGKGLVRKKKGHARQAKHINTLHTQ